MTAAQPRAYRDIAEIKLNYPLLDVVERAGVRLRRAGARRWQGLCPFHEDHNPSFFVDVEDQRFVCFGCKSRGDVLDFVRMHEHLNTVGEACAWLTGTPVPPTRQRAAHSTLTPQQDRRWDRLTLEEQLVLNTAGALYRDALWRNPRARAYLTGRGLPDWVVRACGLGYSDGRSLEAHLRKHGGLRIAEDLGLLRRPERGEGGRMLRERFAGRVVVPELRGGQPVWFIGRYPDEQKVRVKYLGLPGERPILGFEQAAGRRAPDRLGWLARARVIFGVLDGDRAGREAADRFGQALGRRWQPLELPEGCDLNDLGRQLGGRGLFFQLVASARETAADATERIARAQDVDD